MRENAVRRKRLDDLLGLAQTYKSWNRKQLAKALGRDPSNLVPDSGVPKIDLVIRLAQVLDWPVEDVVQRLWDDDRAAPLTEDRGIDSFESFDAASKQAHREGRYDDMLELARQAYEYAETPDERARAFNRELGAWDGMGRYRKVQEVVQKALQETGVSRETRMKLQVNLAVSYYTLWHLTEAISAAHMLVDWFDHHPPTDRINRITQAMAYYSRGHGRRRMLTIEPDSATEHATLGRNDLENARRLYLGLSRDFDDDAYAGIANTCHGGIIELQAFLGETSVEEALAQITTALNGLNDPSASDYPVGDWLESYGWWCIFGCNIALRHLDDQRELQKSMAVFTNKADEIAGHLGNWSMRERVFTMEHARRQRFSDWTGIETEWTIQDKDIRLLAGTMGRIPVFQPTGWEILRTAKVVRDN